MKITRQNLDGTVAPIETRDRIHLLPDGTVHLVLDDDIFDRFIDTDGHGSDG